MPDLIVSVDMLIAEGDRVAAMVTIHGTHTGTDTDPNGVFAGAPTGNEITLRLNTVIYLVDGRIVEEWITVDMLGFMQRSEPCPPRSSLAREKRD